MAVWDRLPEESTKAHAAFVLFKDLGPGRTLRETAAIYYDDEGYREGAKRVPGRMRTWSADHDWVARAQAHDGRDEEIRNEAIERHELTKADDLGARRAALRERIIENGERAAANEKQMLDWPLSRQEVIQPNEEGELVRYIFEPAGWSKRTAKAMHDIVRFASGQATPIDVRTFDPTKLTAGQLDRIIDGEDLAVVLGDDGPQPIGGGA